MEVVALFDLPQQRRRHETFVHHEIGLTRGVKIERGVGLAHRNDVDRLHCDIVRVPIARIFAQPDTVVEAPRFENVGTVADQVAGFDPVVAVLFDDMHRDRKQGDERAQIQEKGRGILQLYPQRAVIRRRDPHLGEIRDPAFVESPRVFHVMQLVGVFRRRGRIERAAPRLHEVARGQRRAVAPGQAFAHLESVNATVGRDFPTLRHAGLRFAVRVERQEALKQGIGHPAFRLTRNQRGIERLRLRPVEKNKIGSRWRRATRTQHQREKK